MDKLDRISELTDSYKRAINEHRIEHDAVRKAKAELKLLEEGLKIKLRIMNQREKTLQKMTERLAK